MRVNRVILSAGIYRSGSTWMFNVTNEIIRLHYSNALNIYSDHLTDEIRDSHRRKIPVLLKSHRPDDELLEFISSTGHAMTLTVRDPLDSIASYMRQFHAPFEMAFGQVSGSADYVISLASRFRLRLFRYEDLFVDKVETIATVAKLLGVEGTIGAFIDIRDRLRREVVADQIDRLVKSGLLDPSRPMESYDAKTHWHANHIGDGMIGKYRHALSEGEIDAVVTRNLEFYSRFYGDKLRIATGVVEPARQSAAGR